jgi:hypothetical protein
VVSWYDIILECIDRSLLTPRAVSEQPSVECSRADKVERYQLLWTGILPGYLLLQGENRENIKTPIKSKSTDCCKIKAARVFYLHYSREQQHHHLSWIIAMFILFLVVSLISSINATSIVSHSQSYPLSQPAVHGPKTRMTIGNGVIAPDGLKRPWVYYHGTQSSLLIFDRATLVDGIFPGPLIAAQKVNFFCWSLGTGTNLTIGRSLWHWGSQRSHGRLDVPGYQCRM